MPVPPAPLPAHGGGGGAAGLAVTRGDGEAAVVGLTGLAGDASGSRLTAAASVAPLPATSDCTWYEARPRPNGSGCCRCRCAAANVAAMARAGTTAETATVLRRARESLDWAACRPVRVRLRCFRWEVVAELTA